MRCGVEVWLDPGDRERLETPACSAVLSSSTGRIAAQSSVSNLYTSTPDSAFAQRPVKSQLHCSLRGAGTNGSSLKGYLNHFIGALLGLPGFLFFFLKASIRQSLDSESAG
jgi:hypothetical protein